MQNNLLTQDSTAGIEETFACKIGDMTPAERKTYEEKKKHLRLAAQDVKELPDGYALRFDAEPGLLVAAAQFVALESRCCSFYAFNLEVDANGGPVWLRITGPEETKSFIKDALEI